MICLHDVLLKRRHDVLRRCNSDVLSVRLHDLSNKFQMKHPTTSQWYLPHQDVSVVGIHDVSSLRLYDVFCKSQIKQPITLLWYASYVSELRCWDGLHIFKLICHEVNIVVFHMSFKYQVKQQFLLVPTRRETIRVV